MSRDAVPQYVWQDREVRFDIPVPASGAFELRPGEHVIDSSGGIEDTKGNPGVPGMLVATNLRLLWLSSRFARTNLSIGYDCVVSFAVRSQQSRVRGVTSSLFVLTKFDNTRFEFIFTNLLPFGGVSPPSSPGQQQQPSSSSFVASSASAGGSPRIFASLQAVHSVYESTRLYRDLKLRGAIVNKEQHQVQLLPGETIYRSLPGVWNLSADQGNLGTLVLTNVRLVWFATMAENFNVSIPFLQIKATKVRESKFGTALVVETMPQSGSYVLGFRIDPVQQLQAVAKELHSVHAVFSRSPLFGVEYKPRGSGGPDGGSDASSSSGSSAPSTLFVGAARRGGDDYSDALLAADDDEPPDTLALTYYAADHDGGAGKQAGAAAAAGEREIEFCAQLGLAIEKLPEGVQSIDQLWQVVHK